MSERIGDMRERLIVQRNDPPVRTVSSITRTGTVATATTTVDHGFAVNDFVTVAGAVPNGYNNKVKVTGVPSSTTFTYTVNGTLATPATGTLTVVYTSNAAGSPGQNFWRTLSPIAAEQIAINAVEQQQLRAIQSGTAYRFRARVRADLEVTQRLLWTPSSPPGARRKTLEITGFIPVGDGRTYTFIEATEAAAP